MILACLGMLAVGFFSAFLPFMPVEAWLVAATAAGQPGVSLGIVAGIGQSTGKVIIFLSARNALRSEWLRRWAGAASRRLRRTKPAATPAKRPSRFRTWFADAGARLVALLNRPAFGVPVIFCSAVTGMPPLLAASVYAARTPMRTPVFGLVCLLGRSIRFVAIGLAPGIFLG